MKGPLTDRQYRRNVWRLVQVEVCWGLGTPFANDVNIIPIFLTALGASTFVLGIVPTLVTGLLCVQPLAGYLLADRPETRRWVWGVHTLGSTLWFVLAAATLWQPALGLSNSLLIVIFLVGYGMIRGLWDLAGAGYMGLVGRCLAPGRSQLGLGLSLLAGCGVGVAASVLSTLWHGAGCSFGVRFAVAFAVVGLLTNLGNLPMLALAETPRSGPSGPRRLGAFIRQGAAQVWADRGFRYYLLFLTLLSPYVLLLYFYAAQAGVDAAGASVLTAFYLAGFAVGNAGMGWIGDRLGPKTATAIGTLVLLAAMFLMLAVIGLAQRTVAGVGPGPAAIPLAASADRAWPTAVPTPRQLLYGVALASGIFVASTIVSRFGMVTQLCPQADVTAYYGISNLVLTPFGALSALGGGYLIGRFGYAGVLIGAMACVGAGLAVLLWKVPGRVFGPCPTSLR